MRKTTLFIALLCFSFSCIAQEDLKVWIMPSVYNVNDYTIKYSQKDINTLLVKNGTEHIQLAVKTIKNATYDINYQQGSPDGPNWQIRKIESMQGYEDALVPVQKSFVSTDTVTKLWISYSADADIEARNYRDKLSIRSGNNEVSIHANIKVADITLPQTPTIPAAFGIVSDNLKSSSPSQTNSNRTQWAELALSHRMNPYFSTWLEGTMKHEAMSSPWQWNDPRTLSFLKDKRFARFALPYHSLNKKELKKMLRWANQEVLISKAYFYLWDEPSLMSEYMKIKAYANEIHSLAPEAKVLTTFYCGPKDGEQKDSLFSVFDLWKGDTQIFSMSAWALQNDEENATRSRSLLKENEEWWTYVCMGPGEKQPNLLLSMSGFQHRAVMWRSWKERVSGFLYWAINAYGDLEKGIAFRSDLPHGDGVLVYPGEWFNQIDPVVSIRMERWRDSMEDYELLVLYEKKFGRAKAEEVLRTVYNGPSDYTDSSGDVQVFRRTLIHDLLK